MRYTSLLLFAILLLAPSIALAEPVVFVSIVPQQFFVDKIADHTIDVEVMVLPGQSPATYEPSPRQMAALSDAAGYLAIGVPFENAWLPRFREASPGLAVFHIDAGIEKRAMKGHHHHGEHHAEEHRHGEHHETASHEGAHHAEEHHAEEHHHGGHEHRGQDPHIWLSPELAQTIARNTCDALVQLAPEQESLFRANLENLLGEIDALDEHIRETLALVPPEKRRFLVFHPSWGYFADKYGLEQLAIEVEGKDPGPAELARIVDRARSEGIEVVFVQPQFSARSAEVVAREIGGRVEVLDPLAADWADNLMRAAATFKKTLQD
ncbi:MAG: metal ABC transporter solute-binding protein, Zn/Mn family [Oceanidesulfovibrio sp.]